MEKNATSLARRFRSLAGLKLLLSGELRALEAARRKALSMLDDITEACNHRPQTLVEQVGSLCLCAIRSQQHNSISLIQLGLSEALYS